MVRIVEPSFVNHDGGAIYSIDAHPSGSKFITCGQKELSSSGVVMIWNMSPIESEKHYKDPNVPKILCQIYTQAGANCVRWSPDGKRFAVGSDDFSVSVWEFIGKVNSAGSVLGKGANIERYREISTCRAHSMEVLSVEWSQNGKYLASSSMDNLIYIWNAKKLGERVACLKGHGDSVKGVAWDPIGKYLATISADKSLKIWQTDNWECCTTITEPFKSSGQKTMFTRLDWSPDGKYLFTPSSTNNNAPTIQIVERQTWNIERDFVGHRKATTCVRVLPRILYAELKNGKKMQLCCVATGSRDRSIAIWLLPGISRPLLALTKIFTHSVMDMMWNGLNLTVCSQDGSILSILFDEKSLGEIASSQMMSDLCQKIYCIRPPQYEMEGLLDEENEEAAAENSILDNSFGSSFVTCPEEVLAKRKKEEESTKTAQEKPKISTQIETENEEAKKLEQKLIEERNVQKEEVAQNGKRRIQPIFLASTSTGEVLEKNLVKNVEKTREKEAELLKKRREIEENEEDLEDESEDDSDDDEDEQEEEIEEDLGENENDKRKKRKRRRNENEEEEDMVMTMNFKQPTLRRNEPASMKVTEGTVVMDAPEKRATIVYNVLDRKNLQFEIDNKYRNSGIETTLVKLVRKKINNSSENAENSGKKRNLENVWTSVIGAVVLNVAANRHISLFGCADRCLRVYLTECGSLSHCIRLDSAPVSIGIREFAGYVLTEYGKLSTWDFQSTKSILSRQPIFECVETSNETSLSSLEISENGIPLILLSNGSVYTFNIGIACWIQVITSNLSSKFFEPIQESQMGDGPLGRLLRRIRRTGTCSNIPTTISKSIKEAQIEQLLNCAEILGNSSDYKSMINLYVETLCDNANEKKLAKLFVESSSAKISICGLRRAAIFEDLKNLVKNRQPSIAARIFAQNSNLSIF
ncbi:unnamed protein product [Caenorhabditis angaria]|uniref:Protein HIRA n=1 Tax=Caenorhabditis angaria TaxID=860376 RepID=A0A9P1IJJ3_9PELO|nr:unnamed protein product [Caenorhabditis angaria]